MKLEESARKAFEILREAGDKGISNIELAQKLKVPKRRVYDIINPLKPLGLIELKKEKGKTKIYWSAKKEAMLRPEKREITGKEEERLKIETVKLKEKEKFIEPELGEQGEESYKFNYSVLKISCDNPAKSCSVYHDGFEVIVETDGESLIVKTEPQKRKTPKVQTVF
ncbi:MAG: E2F family transcription factor [Candidatus Jordarchaeum sp.]|uniref:E2F family transcription factor n=1 Tax=Candidatus Jordarchaeum sp. TaxID=2823881 RepID=UPI00404A16C5